MLNFTRHPSGQSEWVLLKDTELHPNLADSDEQPEPFSVRVPIELIEEPCSEQALQISDYEPFAGESSHLPRWLQESRRNIAQFTANLSRLQRGVKQLQSGISELDQQAALSK